MNRHRRAFITAAILVASSGVVAGTNASYNALTQNSAGTFSTDTLDGPILGGGTALVATNAGSDVDFTFNPGTKPKWNVANTTVGYAVLGSQPTAASGTCPAVTPTSTNYPTVVATAAASATSAAGSGAPYGPTASGGWVCFLLTGTSGNLYSQNNGMTTASTQVGHAVKSVAWTTVNGSGSIRQGDKITITFVQPVNTTNGPTTTNQINTTAPTSGDAICAYGPGDQLVIGTTTYTNTDCNATDVANASVGVLSGINLTASVGRRMNATYAWTVSNTVLTVTIQGQFGGTGNNPTATLVSASFTPTDNAGELLSATDGVAICSAANVTGPPAVQCRPSVPTATI
jgi:hypothetical protein